jgi:predicted transcriptional regulator
MPMMVVDDSDFEKEIENCSKEKNSNQKPIIKESIKPGRAPGDNNVPSGLRKLIGEEAVINGREDALALAKMFDISPSSVSAYTKGATGTDSYNKPNKGLQNYLNSRKERLSKKAMKVARNAIDLLTPEKLAEVAPVKLASIAKDMSAIVKSMESDIRNPIGEQNNNQFVFYAPQFHKEQDYKVIQVNE